MKILTTSFIFPSYFKHNDKKHRNMNYPYFSFFLLFEALFNNETNCKSNRKKEPNLIPNSPQKA